MKEWSFCITKTDKPIIFINHNEDKKTSCLIDTGANMPIWFIGEKYLLHRYPDAVMIDKKTVLSGIGENPIKDVPIWKIPKFILTDDKGEELVYENLLVAVTLAVKFSFDMIIPLTMLNRMKFSFDYSGSAMSALFKISAQKDRYFTRPIYTKADNKYLNMIQIFTQEEEA